MVNHYCSSYHNVNVSKYVGKCGTSSRFWENKGWINYIDPYNWLQWNFRNWRGRCHNGSGKEKAAEYYKNYQEVLRENAKNTYRDLIEEEEKVEIAYGTDIYQKLIANDE